MSEKMTRIKIPGERGGLGLLDWGEKSPSEMISMIRTHFKQNLIDAERMLSYSDDDFQVDIVRGPAVQHLIRSLQVSKMVSGSENNDKP